MLLIGIEATGVKRTFGLWDSGHTVEYCHGWEEVENGKGVAPVYD
jgi:hypothetical protein